MPQMKGLQFTVWLIFLISLPFRLYTNWFVFGALLLGILRKAGKPQFDTAYLQACMFEENFLLLGFAACASMVGAVNLIVYVPLVLHAFVTMAEISCGNPSPGPLSFLP